MPAPREYKDIKRWGIMLSSVPSYIQDQQIKAAQQNAPIDAIYERYDGEGNLSGIWARRADIESATTKMRMDRIEADEQKERR